MEGYSVLTWGQARCDEVIVREVQRRSALEGTLGMSKTRNNIN